MCSAPSTNRLYVGKLPTEMDISSMKQLFLEHNLSVSGISIKKGGHTFVHFTDQSTADKAIDKLTDSAHIGVPFVMEPSFNIVTGKNFSKTVFLSGIPATMGVEELRPYVECYGQVEHIQPTGGKDSNSRLQSWLITYSTAEEAKVSINGLNGAEMDGYRAKAQPAEKRPNKARNQARQGNQGRPTDFPLRLLVNSDMVGAIIGRQGNTIRTITQETRARVDVHRKDNVGSLEKAITIYGNPENCTEACKRILQVMQNEANNTNKGEISLKILAHNNLIGRIIGKAGNTIKRIMQDTDTKITVSSINDINSFNLERIITVKGDSLDNMARAEAQISAKLRQSFENDLQALTPQSIMFPGLHPMALMGTNGRSPYCRAPPPYAPPLYGPVTGPQASGDAQETAYLYIPSNAVGAIIGTKGLHIRNIIRYSNASVKIAPLEQDKPDQQPHDRKVTIIGTPEAQWKAQYLIFEKMREEGYLSGTDDVRLTVEIMVASNQVGRIIGKGGQNVRELQRITGSLIKLPEQGAAQMNQNTTVHIIGPFFSVQSAQRRIRAMVQQASAPARSRKAASSSGSPSQQTQQNQPQQNQQSQQNQPNQQQQQQPAQQQ